MVSLKAAGKAYIKSKGQPKKKKKSNHPGIGEVLLTYWNPSLKAAASVYIARKGKGFVTKRGKAGAEISLETGDMVLDQLNRLLAQNKLTMELADQVIPKHVYTKGSKVMRSLKDFTAIRTVNGEKGWIMANGCFFSEDTFVRQVLRGIDSMSYGVAKGLNLEAMYLDLSVQKKAEFAKKASQIDWDELFKSLYPSNGPIPPLSTQKRKIYDVALQLGVDLHWFDAVPQAPTFVQETI